MTRGAPQSQQLLEAAQGTTGGPLRCSGKTCALGESHYLDSALICLREKGLYGRVRHVLRNTQLGFCISASGAAAEFAAHDAMEVSEQLKCRRPGCGQSFSASSNREDACRHHKRLPLFHDGVKCWPCCEKEAWDWETFMKIEGKKAHPRACTVATTFTVFKHTPLRCMSAGCALGPHSEAPPQASLAASGAAAAAAAASTTTKAAVDATAATAPRSIEDFNKQWGKQKQEEEKKKQQQQQSLRLVSGGSREVAEASGAAAAASDAAAPASDAAAAASDAAAAASDTAALGADIAAVRLTTCRGTAGSLSVAPAGDTHRQQESYGAPRAKLRNCTRLRWQAKRSRRDCLAAGASRTSKNKDHAYPPSSPSPPILPREAT
ncbi:uncharacterized protein LOC34623611 [Cyclospora cayetanensis]|uniref:Uncharacterized protein LOC34623611 n=1 Tax=Cyclospora cayetanensis TaxID=88456 RepID=A0A6P6S112_9EIME|nr:uncharacterized protein LOC34623611 [Cyclospora cayetanensis]